MADARGRTLDIWMGGQRVGVLDGTDRRNLRVVYAEEWADDPRSTPLSVSMPLAGRKLKMAQKIGGEYRPTIIARRHWERLAAGVGGDPEQLVADIADMAARLPDAMATAVAETDLDDADRKAAATILDAVVTWTASCRSAVAP